MVTHKKKNVVLFSFDDAISYWHYKDVFSVKLQTPTLDEICDQSTAFHAAYCQSPVCNTSRASFMTGKSPHQIDFINPYDKSKGRLFDFLPADQIWSLQLKLAGYFCSSGGKVHHGYKPLPPSVHEQLYSDERKAFRKDLGVPPKISQTRSGGFGSGLSTLDAKDDRIYYDANSAQSFIDFIENYDGEEPFYREVGFYSPHMPFTSPVRFKDLYPLNKIQQPDSWENGFAFSEYANTNIRQNFAQTGTRYWKKSVRNYFAAYSHGDYNLGKVWRALKNSKFADNTILIILTDHGMHLGDKARFGKSTLWEQTACVPFIIHDPSNAVPGIVDDPVGLIDVGPTVLDYAGLSPIEGTPGRSLRNVVAGGASDPDRAVPTFNHHGSAIRKGDYRLIEYNDGSTEFYNLRTDWWQQEMLGEEHPDFAATKAALRTCCLEYGQTKFPDP